MKFLLLLTLLTTSAFAQFVGFPSGSQSPAILNAKGDLFTNNGVTDVVLFAGTAGQVLVIDLTEPSGLKWVDPTVVQAQSVTTTQGDLILRGVVQDERLPIGLAGQILTSNGTTASWLTPVDTVYDDTAIQAEVDLNTAKISNVDHPLVETAVPLGAVFTDTVYDDTAIQAEVDLNTVKVSNVDHPLVETAVPLGAVFTDNDTVYDDTAIQAEVDLNTLKVSNIAHPIVLKFVPADAVFTDTVYDDTVINAKVTLNTARQAEIDLNSVHRLDNGSQHAFIDQDVSTSASPTFANVSVLGNLDIQGTTTTLNTATLSVEDTNVTINQNGNDTTAEGAGITINRSSMNGSIAFEYNLPSKFKVGLLGLEKEIVDVSSVQTLTNKIIEHNDLTNMQGGQAGEYYHLTNAEYMALGGGGGGMTFLDLADTPANYDLSSLKAVRVNAGATGLEYYTPEVSPTTTNGDLIYRDAVSDTRLPVGTNGQVLTSNGTYPTWSTPVAPLSAFISLTDTPASFATASLKSVRVNFSETALEYFTPVDNDTIYDDTAIQAEVDLNTAKVSNVDHPLVETAVPLGAVFTDNQTSVTGNSGSTDALKSATTTIDVVSATAPTVGQVLTATSSTSATWQDATGGGGGGPNVVDGPASATDNAIARFDSTTGKLIQNSTVTIDDDGRIGVDATALGNSVYIGDLAGAVDDKTNNNNVGVGWHALILNTSGYYNTAIGYGSQRKTSTGRNNTSLGYQSLYNIQSAVENTGVGTFALSTLTSGFGNTALGNAAGTSINSGSYNTALGYQALRNTSGDYNIAIGWKAGYGTSTVAQAENIWIGKQAGGSVTTGSRNLVIGNGADIPTATTNDYMNIGDMIKADMTTDVVEVGNLTLTNLPVYADDASAGTGGLTAGRVYRTATGELRIKL